MMKCVVPFREGIDKIQPYQPGKPAEAVEREYGVPHAIKLASNENSFGPSRLVEKEIKKTINNLALYPDGSCFNLRKALAKKNNCQADELIIGNGSNELLVLLGMAALNQGDQVVTSEMTFVVYAKIAQLMQAELITIPMKDYTIDLEAMAAAITNKTKLIFIANPNNPTGTALDPMQLVRFIKKVPATCLVVLDEAYYEYMDEKFQTPSTEWIRHHQNIAVLRTFSKAYGLAGLRLGYGIVSPAVYQAVERVREPFNVNALAQVAGLACLQDEAYMRKCLAVVQKEKAKMFEELQASNLMVTPSQTNFFFVNVSKLKGLKEPTGQCFYETLIAMGIIIRPMPGPYARITIGKPSENSKVLKAIRKL